MEQAGSLTVWVTTSRAQLPVEGATVIVTTTPRGTKPTIRAVLETNENGIAGPIQLPAPATPGNGTTPGGPTPFNMYALWVEHPGYEIVFVDGFQIFPNVQSVQSISLIPLNGSQGPSNTSDGRINAIPQAL